MNLNDLFLLAIGMVIGGLGVWLTLKTREVYKKAQGATAARTKAMTERAKQRDKAREESIKRRNLFFRAALFLLMLLIFAAAAVGAIAMLLSG
ncbi:MAG: hypothetical protein KDD92_15600 [Caldilineaceae bacterium]|nr:hypothetical protein [Caldilineaceae bacterium]